MKRFITIILLVFLAGLLADATASMISKEASKASKHDEWRSQKKFNRSSLKNEGRSFETFYNRTKSRVPVKSTNILKQRLDSIIHQYATPWKSLVLFNDMKALFYYDASQVETHEILYSYDINQSLWELDTRTDFTYNPNGQPDSYVDSDWDINLLQWVPAYKVDFTYDANGNVLTETEFYMYAPSTVWEPDRLYEYVWDASNQLISETEKYWNVDSNAFINQYKTDYSYLSGNILSETHLAWNESNSFWVNQNKNEYSYNMSMQVILAEVFGWNEGNSLWDAYYRTTYAYNTSGDLALEEGFEYYNSIWTFTYKTEYQYDLNGNNIEINNFYYNSFDSIWEPSFNDHIAYNVNYAFNDLILPTTWWWFGTEAGYMITQMSGEKWESGSWEQEYDDTFYYTEVNVTGLEENNNLAIRVFPNPACNDLFVQWDSPDPVLRFDLFDGSGRIVLSQLIDKHSKLDINSLGQGFYFYQLHNNTELITSGKISVL